MKDKIKCVRIADYPKFKEEAIKRCGWTINQYNERYHGRTKLTVLEEKVINQLLEKYIN